MQSQQHPQQQYHHRQGHPSGPTMGHHPGDGREPEHQHQHARGHPQHPLAERLAIVNAIDNREINPATGRVWTRTELARRYGYADHSIANIYAHADDIRTAAREMGLAHRDPASVSRLGHSKLGPRTEGALAEWVTSMLADRDRVVTNRELRTAAAILYDAIRRGDSAGPNFADEVLQCAQLSDHDLTARFPWVPSSTWATKFRASHGLPASPGTNAHHAQTQAEDDRRIVEEGMQHAPAVARALRRAGYADAARHMDMSIDAFHRQFQLQTEHHARG
ncbi:hypothetical protein H9P43_000997 [Blastocladiella emersonii ATCC 22665]|nr:hypothetical protein H9P43_000997 [Blastocladiella emersonii ATCC 22665]